MAQEGGAGTEDWHESNSMFVGDYNNFKTFDTRCKAYRHMWDSIYANKGFGWDANPWVWVYTFEKVGANEIA